MPGESARINGRLGGRPKLFATKLHEELIRLAEEKAAPLAKVLMDKALEGEVPAIKEMMDRAIGKALQNVDVTSGGEKLRHFDMTPEVALAAAAMDEAVKKQIYGTSENSDSQGDVQE